MYFNDLKINELVKKSINHLELSTLTPIQEEAIPLCLEGKDIIAQAPTGTGKTFAYSIPLIENIDSTVNSCQGLIICPTRELAQQVCGEIRKLLKYVENVKVLCVYGGQSIDIQIRGLKDNPKIIVGTPGRIIDHIKRKTMKVDYLKFLVLDEADEMLNMGFIEDIDEILSHVTTPHQTMLFSATLPTEIKKIATKYLSNPCTVKTLNEKKELPEVTQYYVELLEKNKIDCLCRMLDAYNFKQALVFCKTKKAVDELSLILVDRGYKIECLHGDLKQVARDKVMKMFKEGIVKVLVATDVAARGLDVSGIDVVFNYDIPEDVEYYVHRIGRTARANTTGSAYTFVNRKEKNRLLDYERQLKTKISKILPPTLEEAKYAKMYNKLTSLQNDYKEEDITEYKEYLNNYLAAIGYTVDLSFLAASLLKIAIEGDAQNQDLGEDFTIIEEKKKSKKDYKVQGFTRLFINLGLKDDLKKVDLLDLVKTKRHVNNNEIINVDVLSTYSFFDIPDKRVEVVMNTLNEMSYNGRKISVEIAGSRYNNDVSKRKTRKNTKKDSKDDYSSDKKQTSKSKKLSKSDSIDKNNKQSKLNNKDSKNDRSTKTNKGNSNNKEKGKKEKKIKINQLDIKW